METRILLVEDHDIVRDGIKFLLETEAGFNVVGQARDGQSALSLVPELKPDLVVLDMNMPIMNGLECTRKLKREFPMVKVLILSMHDHENYLIDLLDAGADGYLLKSTSKDELIFAIKKILKNGVYIASEFTLSMLKKYKAAGGTSSSMQTAENLNISSREMDVLKLIAQGKTNSEIANTLFTSVRTIETRRKNLLDKTGTQNTATLIRFAVLNRLVK